MAKSKIDEKVMREKCRIITPEFRVSYPHLFKPQAPMPGSTSKPKFSITMLFPKKGDLTGSTGGTNPRSITLQDVIRNAKLAEYGSQENWPDDLVSPVKNGDSGKYSDNEGYPGHWIISASSNEDQRPSVVDRDMTPLDRPSDLYPGCYARAYLLAYCWAFPNKQKPMKRGVGFILDHVQKLRDGKTFGGKKPVDQVFGALGAASDETELDDFSDDEDLDAICF